MFDIHNQIFAAPLAGITDRPFRRLMREFAPNAPLVTEMISCHSLVGRHRGCLRNFDVYTDEGPVGAQIFGADADLMADAAKILQDNGAKWIDINMGCPVPKVATRAGAGAFLMRDHALAGRIIGAVARAVQIPVSIKTRLGWDADHCDWMDLIRIAADNGASFAALHGRTRAQLYVGPNCRSNPKPQFPLLPMVISERPRMLRGCAHWDMTGRWSGADYWAGHGFWANWRMGLRRPKISGMWFCDIWIWSWTITGPETACRCSGNMPRGIRRG